jgi:hypothetical protein
MANATTYLHQPRMSGRLNLRETQLSPSPHDASPSCLQVHQTQTRTTSSIMRPHDSPYTHASSICIRNGTTRHPLIISERVRKRKHTRMAYKRIHYLPEEKDIDLSPVECRRRGHCSVTIKVRHQLTGNKIFRNQPLKALNKLVVLNRYLPPKAS